jgi:hypothetical protein
MARSAPPSAPGQFNIIRPAPGEAVPLGPGNTIRVEVDDIGGHDEFWAAIYDSCDPQSPPLSKCPHRLLNVGSGNTYRCDVPVHFLDPFDILEPHKQVVVWGVVDEGKGPMATARTALFMIYRGGSGSGSGIPSASGSQRHCQHCSADQPIPVAVRVTPAGVTSSTCASCEAINAPTLMLHSGDACLVCCWFSAPVAFCGQTPGYWRLEKENARDWELRFVRAASVSTGAEDVAVYRATTAADGDCSFPVTLNLQSSLTHCANWPATLTVEAAP